ISPCRLVSPSMNRLPRTGDGCGSGLRGAAVAKLVLCCGWQEQRATGPIRQERREFLLREHARRDLMQRKINRAGRRLVEPRSASSVECAAACCCRQCQSKPVRQDLLTFKDDEWIHD